MRTPPLTISGILLSLLLGACSEGPSPVTPFATSDLRKNAIDASVAAYAAYLSAPEAATVLQSREMTPAPASVSATPFRPPSEALAVSRGSDLLIAFTGTNDLADLLRDLNILAIHRDGVAYHGGFLGAAQPFVETLAAPLTDWRSRNPSATLLLTGHSLGGAIATIAGIQLARRGVRIDGVYTFGSPGCMLGSFELAEGTYTQENYVNLDDRIPSLLRPLYSTRTGMPGRYFDVGNDGSVVERDTGWNLSPEKYNYTEGPTRVAPGLSRILGHSMARYMNAMLRGDAVVIGIIEAVAAAKANGTLAVRRAETEDDISPEAKRIIEVLKKAGALRDPMSSGTSGE